MAAQEESDNVVLQPTSLNHENGDKTVGLDFPNAIQCQEDLRQSQIEQKKIELNEQNTENQQSFENQQKSETQEFFEKIENFINEDITPEIARHPLYPHVCGYAYKCAAEGILDLSTEEVIRNFLLDQGESKISNQFLDRIMTNTFHYLRLMLEDMRVLSDQVETTTNTLLLSSLASLKKWEEEKEVLYAHKNRSRLSRRARDILQSWILKHQNHPYPTKGI
jgi:hypothetical protein